jgi:hypothetical protein
LKFETKIVFLTLKRLKFVVNLTLCKVIDVSVILFHDSISPMNITFRGFYFTNSIQSLPKVYHTMIMFAFFNLIFLISTALICERAQVLKNQNVVIDYSPLGLPLTTTTTNKR